jgi:hypothetical protein
VAWAALYLPHLGTSPRWYGDEFVTLLAGRSILDGTFANRALHHSFFSGFTNYQPAGCFLFALFGRVFWGAGILGARLFAALLGLATALGAFHLLFRRGWIGTGLAAALTVLAAPEAMIHFRRAYPHALAGLGVMLVGLLLDRPRTTRRDWGIGLACAVAALGHLLVVHVTLAALLARWRWPGAWWRIALPPALVLLASLSFGYLISGRQLFADLGEVALQYRSHAADADWRLKVATAWRFFTWDWLHVIYAASLVVLGYQRRWALTAFAAVLSGLVIQNRPELPIFYYQAMVFAPLLSACVALAIRQIATALAQEVPRWPRRLVPLAVPVLLLVPALRSSWAGTLQGRNETWVAPSLTDLEQTAAWVNARAGKDDLVVAFWDVGWMLQGRWTDLLQAAAWQYGSCPEFYQRHRDRSEFRFPAELSRARYVIVGPLDRLWTFAEGNVPRLLQEVRLGDQWPVVARTATTVVLGNPAGQEGGP